MGLFSFFRRGGRTEATGPVPWQTGESIYEYVKARIDSRTRKFVSDERELPDDPKRNQPRGVRWVAGGLDGAFGHHGAGEGDAEVVAKLAGLLEELARTGAVETKIALYRTIEAESVLNLVDPVLEQLRKRRTPVEPHLLGFCRELALHAPDREPVKFAVALLGVMRDANSAEIFRTIGRHEEFTLFAATALINSVEHAEPELFALAQSVEGWGRVHLVERLAETQDPGIKRWLLREGYQNAVMYEYTAYICATTGGLADALAEPVIDDEMLHAAGELIVALITGGPAADIRDFADAAVVFERYLVHLPAQPSRVYQHHVLCLMQDHLKDAAWDASARAANGWTEARRQQCLEKIEERLADARWAALIEAGLSSEDEQEFFWANSAATRRRIDTWDVHWRRLHAKPDDSGRWLEVMSHVSPDQIDAVIAFAESTLALDRIASGPALEMGFGPKFRQHSCLDSILQALDRFPGRGEKLIMAGLHSPVIRVRNMALKALAAWEPGARDARFQVALKRAQVKEPDDAVRDRIRKLIAGEELN